MVQQTAAPVEAGQVALLQLQNSDVGANDLTVVNRDHVRARLRMMLIWKCGFDPFAAGAAEAYPTAVCVTVRQRLRAPIIGRFFDDVCCGISASSLAAAATFDRLTAAVWHAIPARHKSTTTD